MIFLREFYDEKGKVSTKNKWVWVVHALNYPYIIYVYVMCELSGDVDHSQARRMWVPLDIILTFLIVCYQIFYRLLEVMEKSPEKGEEENDNELAQDDFVKDKEYEMTPRNALNNSGEGDNFAKGETTALVTQSSKMKKSAKRGLMAKMKSLSSTNLILKKDSMFSFEKEKT